jgi:hypothetical protein
MTTKAVPTGLAPFDAVTGGIRPGQVWMHGGCVGDLKSTWALNLALNATMAPVAANVGLKSFERSSHDVTRDFIALRKRMNAGDVRRRMMNLTAIYMLKEGEAQMRKGELTAGRFEAVTLENPSMRDLARYSVDMMIIDGVPMTRHDPGKGLERVYREAKMLALGSFGGNPKGVVVIQQFNRDWASRFGYREGSHMGGLAHVDVITTSHLDDGLRQEERALFRMLRNGENGACAEPFLATVDWETLRVGNAVWSLG